MTYDYDIRVAPVADIGLCDRSRIVLVESPDTTDLLLAEVVILPELFPCAPADSPGKLLDAREYQRFLTQNINLLVPLLKMARDGPVTLAFFRAELAGCLEAIKETVVEQLQLEDLECSNEHSSPTCYADDDKA